MTLCALRRTYQLDQAAMLQVGDRSQGEATCETRAYVGLQEECLSDMGQGFRHVDGVLHTAAIRESEEGAWSLASASQGPMTQPATAIINDSLWPTPMRTQENSPHDYMRTPEAVVAKDAVAVHSQARVQARSAAPQSTTIPWAGTGWRWAHTLVWFYLV